MADEFACIDTRSEILRIISQVVADQKSRVVARSASTARPSGCPLTRFSPSYSSSVGTSHDSARCRELPHLALAS
jgi:hypothetical protein